jgi:hypothetical protein
MRFALAAIFAAHGFAHLAGFIVPWRWVDLKEMPYKTTLLAGRFDVGPVGIRAVSILWLLAALAFFVVAVAAVLVLPWWLVTSVAVSAGSLVLCILGWPDSRIGAFINLGILVLLGAGNALGWIS